MVADLDPGSIGAECWMYVTLPTSRLAFVTLPFVLWYEGVPFSPG